jgi:hypothetical protein
MSILSSNALSRRPPRRGTNRVHRVAVETLEHRRLLSLTNWWKLDEASGTTAVDAVAGGRNGTATNGPTWQSAGGQINGALRFDGVNDYVAISSTVATGSAISVAFWMRADTLKMQVPIDKMPSGTGGVGWNFKVRSDGSIWLRIGSNSSFTDVKFAGAYAANTWVHVVGTFAAGTGRLYTDGVLRATVTGITQSVGANTTSLRLGQPLSVATTELFDGDLDDVRLYDHVLSTAEISAIYTLNAGLASAVAALPSATTQQALKKATLNWAIADAVDSESAGLTQIARDTYDDVRNLLAAGIGFAQPAPANLLPGIPNFSTNPLASSAVTALNTLRNSTTTYTKNAGDFTSTVSTQGREMAWGLTHPQSPLAGDATLLTGTLRRFQKTFESNLAGTLDGDFMVASPAAEMYLLVRTVYPDLILPSRKVQWEAAIKLHADTIDAQQGAKFRAAVPGTSWVNADVRWMLGLRFAYDVLGTTSYRDTAASALQLISGSLLPDGGFLYDAKQNDVYTYHGDIITALARYWQVTGEPLARELVVDSYWYYPLSVEPNGTPEYSSGASWKHYWNQVTGSEAAYVVAALANSPENLRVAKWFTPSPSLFLSTFHRADLVASASPQNYITYDRNVMGPRGRFGTFSYVGTASPYTGENRGKRTFVGAMVTDFTGSNNAWRLNAALDSAQTRVRYATGPDNNTIGNDVSGPTPIVYYDAAQQERNAYTVDDRFATLSTDYVLSKYKGAAQPNWRGDQQWLFLQDRIVGLATLESLTTQSAYAMVGSLRFVSGRAHWGTARSFVQVNSNTWSYGKLTVRIVEQDYGAVTTSYEDTWDDKVDVIDNKTGRLNFVDSAAAAANESSLISYPAGTRKRYLVEIRPDTTTTAPTTLARIEPGNGLRGIDYALGSTRFRTIANPTDNPITYIATLPWSAGGAIAHFAGETYRAPFLSAFDQPDTDTRGRWLTAKPLAAFASNTVSITVAPHEHVTLRDWLPGDVTDDGRVNFDDLLVLAANYNTTGKPWTQGNVDGSPGGEVNFDDLLILASNYNRTLAATNASLSAPPPSSTTTPPPSFGPSATPPDNDDDLLGGSPDVLA